MFIIILFIACRDQETNGETKTDENKIAENKVYLSSWADTARLCIGAWVKEITNKNSSGFIPVADRVSGFSQLPNSYETIQFFRYNQSSLNNMGAI